MALLIRWTPRASNWLNLQYDYWEENDMHTTLQKFSKGLDNKLTLLSNQPEIGRPTSDFKKIRFVSIDKRYHLFYRIKTNDITLLTFFDTKQNPDKRPY